MHGDIVFWFIVVAGATMAIGMAYSIVRSLLDTSRGARSTLD